MNNKDDLWNSIPYKLECKEVENYDKVMGTNYLRLGHNSINKYCNVCITV